MSTLGRNDVHEDEDPASIWPMPLVTGSTLVIGYLVGRASYHHDVRATLRRIEDLPEPIDVYIRTL